MGKRCEMKHVSNIKKFGQDFSVKLGGISAVKQFHGTLIKIFHTWCYMDKESPIVLCPNCVALVYSWRARLEPPIFQ